MSKQEARSEAKYARSLITELLAATDPLEREKIANELLASVSEIANQLDTPNYTY